MSTSTDAYLKARHEVRRPPAEDPIGGIPPFLIWREELLCRSVEIRLHTSFPSDLGFAYVYDRSS
jgi:hypothetical protein